MPMSPMYDELRQRLEQAIGTANSSGQLAYVRSYTVSLAQLVLWVEVPHGEPIRFFMREVERAEFCPRWRTICLSAGYDERGRVSIADAGAGFRVSCAVVHVSLGDASGEDEEDGSG